MSATELIEQLKTLPAQEQETFAGLFHRLEKLPRSAKRNANSDSTENWPDFGDRLRHIYGNKVVADCLAVASLSRGDW